MGAPEDRQSKFLPDPYFHSDHLPEPELQYVAWLDLMGTTNMMEYSFKNAATNICKLHLIVAQQQNYESFHMYPMNDGICIASHSYQPLREFLSYIFSDYAEILISNVGREGWDPLHLAIPRAAISYGHLYHPRDIRRSALTDYQYASSILLGEPMTVAHRKESEASPFGIISDESVHEEDGDVKWWNDAYLARHLFIIFDEYLRACEERPQIEYPDEARERHRTKAQEYLIDQN